MKGEKESLQRKEEVPELLIYCTVALRVEFHVLLTLPKKCLTNAHWI